MITKEQVKKMVERLEALKKLTLEKYLDEIDDLNSDILLYDVMFQHLVKHDFDGDYEFSCLEGLEKREKDEIKELTDKYQGLCFYDGKVDYWSDSTEITMGRKNYKEVTDKKDFNDYELTAGRLLDNYEFLITLAKEGGEEVLEKLTSLEDKEGFNESSVIEYLRNTYPNDNLLVRILCEMSSSNSLFKVFTDGQKEAMLRYPEGVLYSYGKEKIVVSSPLPLAVKICNYLGDNITLENTKDGISSCALEVTEKLREINNEDFLEIISEMSDNYTEDPKNNFMYLGSYSNLPIEEEGYKEEKTGKSY